MRSRTRVLVVAGVGLLVIGVLAVLRDHRRDQEWQHGGDPVTAQARVIATAPSGFGDALVAVGETPEPGVSSAEQMYVVHVSWEGSPDSDGSYQFILLDGRLSPPKPIAGYGAWSDGSDEGANWSGAYEVLPDHYSWLAGTASRHTADGWTNDSDALGVSAGRSGQANLAFMLGRDDLPTAQPAEDLLLAMVFVADDGDVRWAKQVELGS